MKAPRELGLLQYMVRAALPGAAPAVQSSRSSAPASAQQAWESDPRWGREHWHIRKQPIQWPKKEQVAVVFAIPFGFSDMTFNVPGGGGYPSSFARIHTQIYGVKAGLWRLLDLLGDTISKLLLKSADLLPSNFPMR